MEKYFELNQNGTSIKQEFVAAFVTFCSMVYILIVNANMYTNPFGNGENILCMPFGAIYIGTALSAVVGCMLLGFIVKLPIAMASGMGLNAFFIYTACIALGFSYENALLIILAEGLIFLVLTLTGGIKKIYESIPDSIRISISAGIGLFIAFLGLLNSGIIISDKATGIALISFNILNTPLQQTFPAFITIFSLFVIPAFSTICMMPYTCNISNGIAFGLLSYVIINVFIGKIKEIKLTTLVIVILFLTMLLLTH